MRRREMAKELGLDGVSKRDKVYLCGPNSTQERKLAVYKRLKLELESRK